MVMAEHAVAEASEPAKASKPLRPLREDLKLFSAAPDNDGAPLWAIQDPVTNRFYRIGWAEFEFMLRWPGQPDDIATDINANSPLHVTREQILEFSQFLDKHNLLRPSAESLERMREHARQPRWRSWKWWLHQYLFVRVPLVRPQPLLEKLLPFARPLVSKIGIITLMLLSMLGFILVARQWDTFTHSVMDMLTPEGINGFLIALVISKTVHELGHALVSVHYGTRVAHMGVAFIVMWPMLYTDTGETWRLRSSRQRLAIASAGVSAELALAGLSTLAWAVMDDGILRQAMLYLATTGWVLSLAINVSPFMRFDGYFILSDWLNFPNLHERSSAVARCWLRRNLLGWNDSYPEELTNKLRKNLIIFAFITWAYRLVVFLGIALMVYFLFFKALGVFLFVIEIYWFIVRPVWAEVKVWKERKHEITKSRKVIFYVLCAVVLTLLAMPWRFSIDAPAYAHAERQQIVYAPFPAKLMSLQSSGEVAAGASLVVLSAPDLQTNTSRIEGLAYTLERQLAGLLAIDGVDKLRATTQRLYEQMAEAKAIKAEYSRLKIVAEFSGHWLDLDTDLREGAWVSHRNPIGVLIDPTRWLVTAYVNQSEIERLESGATATFYPQGAITGVRATVLELDNTPTKQLEHIMMDARYGGRIVTQQSEQNAVPAQAIYRVRLQLQDAPSEWIETRGRVSIEGQPRSVLWSGIKHYAAIIIRESGF